MTTLINLSFPNSRTQSKYILSFHLADFWFLGQFFPHLNTDFQQHTEPNPSVFSVFNFSERTEQYVIAEITFLILNFLLI